MFGYVHADRNQLSQDDLITYQRYYCGLCQELHNISGFKGQLLLNYDLTFMTILLSGLYESKTDTKEFRCIIHPVNKKHAFINDATKYAAAMDIILSYHSLMDKYHDDNAKSAYWYGLALKKDYEEIKKLYPRQVAAVEEYINKLSEAEKSHETNLDIISNYTGEMLGCLFNWKDDEWSKDLEAVGFYLGKFIYILDAYEDMKKDEKTGSFNALLALKKKETNKDFETFVRTALTSLMAECAKSFERLPIVENTEILRNIIYSGVWTKYEYLQLKDKKKSTDYKETKA